MRIGLNQFSWPTSMSIEKVFEDTKRAGYDSIELCYTQGGNKKSDQGSVADALDLSNYVNPLLNDGTGSKEIELLGELSKGYDLPISSIGGIATFTQVPFNSTDEETAAASMNIMKSIVDCAKALHVNLVQLIPGYVNAGTNYEDNFHLLVKRVQKLADYAGRDLTIGIENVWNGFLYTPLEFKHFIDAIDRPNVGAYLDIGNVRRFGFPEQWILTLGDRVKCLHLKDYSLANDNINSFTNLLGGDVNFIVVAKALKSIAYDGMAHVEIIPPAKSHAYATLAFARDAAEIIFNNNDKE